MAQRIALTNALKSVLKARGVTYSRIAAGLALSEASVKRIFSRRSFTLERLDEICDLVGIEITDLARIVRQETDSPAQLSRDQEEQLVSNPKLLLVAIHVLSHWSFDEIVSTYDLSRAECIKQLTRLDKLGLIDLLPHNKVRVRVTQNFSWLPDGPIQHYFRAHVRDDFLRSQFEQDGEMMVFVSGMLAQSSNAAVRTHLRRLVREFSDLDQQDAHLPLAQRFGTSLLLAIRPWSPQSFRSLRKKPSVTGSGSPGGRAGRNLVTGRSTP
jgi:DNA-binding Xre family transcriptional regulator